LERRPRRGEVDLRLPGPGDAVEEELAPNPAIHRRNHRIAGLTLSRRQRRGVGDGADPSDRGPATGLTRPQGHEPARGEAPQRPAVDPACRLELVCGELTGSRWI